MALRGTLGPVDAMALQGETRHLWAKQGDVRGIASLLQLFGTISLCPPLLT